MALGMAGQVHAGHCPILNQLRVPKLISWGLRTRASKTKFELLSTGVCVCGGVLTVTPSISTETIPILLGLLAEWWSSWALVLHGLKAQGVGEGYLKCFRLSLALFPGGTERVSNSRQSKQHTFWFGREMQTQNLTCLYGCVEPNTSLLTDVQTALLSYSLS